MVAKEEEKVIDNDFITPMKPLSVKKSKTMHEITETSIEHDITDTATEHEITDTATVVKRKTFETELDDSVFKNEDVGDLGPIPQKTIPKLNLDEIKKHLTQRSGPDNSSHTYQVRFIINVLSKGLITSRGYFLVTKRIRKWTGFLIRQVSKTWMLLDSLIWVLS